MCVCACVCIDSNAYFRAYIFAWFLSAFLYANVSGSGCGCGCGCDCVGTSLRPFVYECKGTPIHAYLRKGNHMRALKLS